MIWWKIGQHAISSTFVTASNLFGNVFHFLLFIGKSTRSVSQVVSKFEMTPKIIVPPKFWFPIIKRKARKKPPAMDALMVDRCIHTHVLIDLLLERAVATFYSMVCYVGFDLSNQGNIQFFVCIHSHQLS